MPFCGRCGKPVENDVRFCPSCGTLTAGASLSNPLRPEDLSKATHDYNEQYEKFMATNYQKLLVWIQGLLKVEASHGGEMLSLSVNHSTSKVEADGLGLLRAQGDRYFAEESRCFALPFSRSTRDSLMMRRVAGRIADYFRSLRFDVRIQDHKATYRRSGSTPQLTEVVILWNRSPTQPADSGPEPIESDPRMLEELLARYRDWASKRPRQYSLRFGVSSKHLVAGLDQWDVGTLEPDSLLFFIAEYFLAAHYLLEGATFDANPDPVDMSVWTMGKVSQVCDRLSAFKRTDPSEFDSGKKEYEQDTFRSRMEAHLEVVQGDIEKYCAKHRWKIHKDTT